MSSPVITVENLGKRYTLRHQARSGLLRDKLASLLRNPFRQLREARATAEEFWALRDVSFSVNQGDVLGIIGRNGAGKSTLLKILSRITEPTTGRIAIQGRVASLLEVGTGFHGELSGRENIFLNGAILGMKRAEIRRKFDEIVSFAEVEKFLDTPVKHYSSGMYVRLAFAVAAHLEPEILIVDEVLAVGDVDFQRKCLRKMNAVTREEGRTILFVSHQLQAIQQLCNRVLVLNQGLAVKDADTTTGLGTYTALNARANTSSSQLNLGPALRLTSLAFKPATLSPLDDLGFSLSLVAESDCAVHDLCILLYNSFGQRVAIADLRQSENSYKLAAGHSLMLRGSFARIALAPGRYSAGLFIKTSSHMADHMDLASLEIQPPPASKLVGYAPEHLGTTVLDLTFSSSIETTSRASSHA